MTTKNDVMRVGNGVADADGEKIRASNEKASTSPGPWMVIGGLRETTEGECYAIVGTANGALDVIAPRSMEKHHMPNAHLIASAPDLLAACQNFVNSFKSLQREKCDVAHRMALAAIAKAEGRT